MNRTGRRGEPTRSGGATPVSGPTRKVRKKARTPAEPEQRLSGPIPAPYLALAPSPVSSLSPSALDELSSQLVLPSHFRSGTGSAAPSSSTPPLGFTSASTPNLHSTTAGNGSSRRNAAGGGGATNRGYAAGLLAPPTILPGGTASTPRIQPLSQADYSIAHAQGRRRSSDRERARAIVSRRSEERLRELTILNNASLTSLGQLGHILESGRMPEDLEGEGTQQQQQQQQRRRRRIVRAEGGGGLTRRPTVSSREEGRALGLARGASMRRTNVWDDIPESGEPPPPFPFPTTSSNPLPPTFDARPTLTPRRNITITRSRSASSATERPRSPPPSFEIALGLPPLPTLPESESDPQPLTSEGQNTPRARPSLTLSTTAPGPLTGAQLSSLPNSATQSGSNSPTSTHYASAPASPSQIVLSLDENLHLTEDERADRKMWNADLLAGYTLEERVHRELARRKARDHLVSITLPVNHNSSPTAEQSLPLALPSGYAAGICDPRGSTSSGAGLSLTSQGAIEAVPDIGAITLQQPSIAAHEPSPVLDSKPQTAASTATDDINQPEATASVPPPVDDEIANEVEEDVGQSRVQLSDFDGERGKTPMPIPTPTTEDTNAILDISSENNVPLAMSESINEEGTADTNTASQEQVISRSVSPVEEISASDGTAERDAEPELERADNVTRRTAESEQSTESITETQVGIGKSKGEQASVSLASGPIRKLTRGSAIRRRSSEMTLSPHLPRSPTSPTSSTKRRSEGDIGPVVKPLFAGAGYRVGGLSPSPEIPFAPTMSREPALSTEQGSYFPISTENDIPIEVKSGTSAQLPPNREAALRRRLQLQPRQLLPAAPANKRGSSVSRPISGPLIDFNTDFSIPQFTSPDLPLLSPSAVDLLQLQDLPVPVAESSAQAAARAAMYSPLKETESNEVQVVPVSTEKKVPPPPPPSRIARLVSRFQGQAHGHGHVQGDSGDSTPRARSPEPQTTSTFTKSTLPFSRRPPPPPAPPLPPRPASSTIGLFRPVADRSDSTSSMETVVPRFATPPALPQRPRGPRPRPPPPPPRPRNWKVVEAETYQQHQRQEEEEDCSDPVPPLPPSKSPSPTMTATPIAIRARPFAERTQSENPFNQSQAQEENRQSGINLNRSASDVDLRRNQDQDQDQGLGQRQIEYTDLDLLVSRIESSGREFEDFTQITSFLGPSKTPSATPAALATLLPGIISIDSRRTTPQGKVKLKLSLLGVRVSKCPICLNQFKAGDKGVLLPDCGHASHESCALRWFREDGRCFVCREVLKE